MSVVEILRRKDLSSFVDSRRLGVNLRLRELCEENNIGFISKNLVSDLIAREKLHLSELGQDEIARVVFKHCKKYLN